MIEQCLNHLTKLGKPFKYVGRYFPFRQFYIFPVTCVIMQKSGAGLHTASSCYWDSTTDGKSVFAFFMVSCFAEVGETRLAFLKE